MKIDFPIPAELSKQLTDTADTMHRIEVLLQQLVIIQRAQLTVDQCKAIGRDAEAAWQRRSA